MKIEKRALPLGKFPEAIDEIDVSTHFDAGRALLFISGPARAWCIDLANERLLWTSSRRSIDSSGSNGYGYDHSVLASRGESTVVAIGDGTLVADLHLTNRRAVVRLTELLTGTERWCQEIPMPAWINAEIAKTGPQPGLWCTAELALIEQELHVVWSGRSERDARPPEGSSPWMDEFCEIFETSHIRIEDGRVEPGVCIEYALPPDASGKFAARGALMQLGVGSKTPTQLFNVPRGYVESWYAAGNIVYALIRTKSDVTISERNATDFSENRRVTHQVRVDQFFSFQPDNSGYPFVALSHRRLLVPRPDFASCWVALGKLGIADPLRIGESVLCAERHPGSRAVFALRDLATGAEIRKEADPFHTYSNSFSRGWCMLGSTPYAWRVGVDSHGFRGPVLVNTHTLEAAMTPGYIIGDASASIDRRVFYVVHGKEPKLIIYEASAPGL